MIVSLLLGKSTPPLESIYLSTQLFLQVAITSYIGYVYK